MQCFGKILGLVVFLTLTLGLFFNPQTLAFVGGAPVGQTRTIGGKNPLKQRHLRKGNPINRVYHNSSCIYYKSKQSSILFKSPEEARSAGFRPCSQCGG
ncbi:MAG: hypothetical protein IJS50_03040 [Desulfovibrio sp.]|nr:hypothetical protein [Desulfovibrio sp.]